MKAGKVASGEFMTEKAVKTSMAHLVIVAEDASANTKKMFSDMCTFCRNSSGIHRR
jgi:ribosomal protein L7Ae-like RNA K-turn-binding protein